MVPVATLDALVLSAVPSVEIGHDVKPSIRPRMAFGVLVTCARTPTAPLGTDAPLFVMAPSCVRPDPTKFADQVHGAGLAHPLTDMFDVIAPKTSAWVRPPSV
jgi:hypothetical protein